jgi:hypothetical protein
MHKFPIVTAEELIKVVQPAHLHLQLGCPWLPLLQPQPLFRNLLKAMPFPCRKGAAAFPELVVATTMNPIHSNGTMQRRSTRPRSW